MKCYCCGNPGHKSPECPWKNKIPKQEWLKVTNQVVKSSFTQSEMKEEDSDEDDSPTVTAKPIKPKKGSKAKELGVVLSSSSIKVKPKLEPLTTKR